MSTCEVRASRCGGSELTPARHVAGWCRRAPPHSCVRASRPPRGPSSSSRLGPWHTGHPGLSSHCFLPLTVCPQDPSQPSVPHKNHRRAEGGQWPCLAISSECPALPGKKDDPSPALLAGGQLLGAPHTSWPSDLVLIAGLWSAAVMSSAWSTCVCPAPSPPTVSRCCLGGHGLCPHPMW